MALDHSVGPAEVINWPFVMAALTGAMSTRMPSMWLDAVRWPLLFSLAKLGVFYAAISLVVSFVQIFGLSWRVIAMPSQMRLIQVHLVQWSSKTMFRTMRAMVSDHPRGFLGEGADKVSADECRALLQVSYAAVLITVGLTNLDAIGVDEHVLRWWG
jgi:hypothetical protein